MRKHGVLPRLLLVIFISSFVVLTAAFAFAEPVTRVVEMRVAAQMYEQHPIIFISATVDDETELPTQVPVALPAGVQIEWVGEISGAEAVDDQETTYEKLETKDGWDIYLVDLTDYRTLQIEAGMTEPYIVTEGSANGSASFTYAPAVDVDSLMLAVEIPATVTNFDQNQGYEVFAQGIGGGMLVGPTFTDVKAGEDKTVSLNFETAPAVDDTAAASGGVDSFNAVVIVLVLALLILIALLFILWNRHNGAPAPESPQGKSARSGASSKNQSARSGSTKGKSGSKPFKWNSPQMLIIALIALAAIGALIWTSQRNANTITENNGVYSQVFAVGDPCMSIDFELTDEAMEDPAKTARELFTLMRTADIQLLQSALDSNSGILTVEFCESVTNDEAVARLIERSGLVSSSNLKTLNVPIVLDDGILVIYLAHQPPCVVSEFTIESPSSDSIAFVEELARAVGQVPSMTGVSFDPKTTMASFGFCEEQADDDVIAEALSNAGINATLTSGLAETTESILAF
ncbi:MAG: hypothetical protein FWE87_02275 [Coriobacteriia bacterium]|nr:hypothetical protein [Coriobacteriia bacterium]